MKTNQPQNIPVRARTPVCFLPLTSILSFIDFTSALKIPKFSAVSTCHHRLFSPPFPPSRRCNNDGEASESETCLRVCRLIKLSITQAQEFRTDHTFGIWLLFSPLTSSKEKDLFQDFGFLM